ncbi:MAG: F0F1 ATP synthase subunit delta [Candidatus Liptonbacteria bacterium]|nr:F0F1 ATP synthase subunit delta [Candidatus Liptonbacteria bacterium]
MKYQPRQYATALRAALEGKDEGIRHAIIKRFLLLLRKNKDGGKLRTILHELMRQDLDMQGLHTLHIESAAPLPAPIRREIKEMFDERILLRESVKEELLGGMTILLDEEIFIDASARRGLTHLFQ